MSKKMKEIDEKKMLITILQKWRLQIAQLGQPTLQKSKGLFVYCHKWQQKGSRRNWKPENAWAWKMTEMIIKIVGH